MAFRRIVCRLSRTRFFNCPGSEVLIRLADVLGIQWHVITDGDAEGETLYSQVVRDVRLTAAKSLMISSHLTHDE